MDDSARKRRAIEAARLLGELFDVQSSDEVPCIVPCDRCGERPEWEGGRPFHHLRFRGETLCRRCLGAPLVEEVLAYLDPPKDPAFSDDEPITFWLAAYRPSFSVACERTCGACGWEGSGRKLDREVREVYRVHGSEGLACWRDDLFLCRGAALRLSRQGVIRLEENREVKVSLDDAVAIVKLSEGERLERAPKLLRRWGFVDIHGVLNDQGLALARDMLAEIERRMLYDDVRGWVPKSKVCDG